MGYQTSYQRAVLVASGAAIGFLLCSPQSWPQQPYTREQASYELASYTASHAIIVSELELCATAFPERRQQFQLVLKKIRSTDVAFFQHVEAQTTFPVILASVREVHAKRNKQLLVSRCERLLGLEADEHASTGVRLSKSLKIAGVESELRTLFELHVQQVAEIEVCVQRFPDTQKRTAEMYRRFRNENREVTRILESRREYGSELRKTREFFEMMAGDLVGICSRLAQLVEERLAEHARRLQNVHALQKDRSIR